MEKNKIVEIQRNALQFLQDRRLKQAINVLNEGMDELGDWELRTRLSEIETAYNFMLEYLRRGMPDPDRKRLHKELIGKCLQLNDEICLSSLAENSLSVYSQHRRKYKNELAADTLRIRMIENAQNISVTNALPADESISIKKELQVEHEKLLDEAFFRIWCSCNWGKRDCEDALALLTEDEISVCDRATLVSAVTAGLLKCFEPRKAVMLCTLALHEKNEISVRALIGLIITLICHVKRLDFYPEIINALHSLKENNQMQQRIETIQIQILRSRETQKIDRKMREEIIPAMMKNPNIGSNKFGMDIIKEMEEEEQNPEWKAWIEEDKIKDKLEEMTRWQIEGADVYMSTFSQLKRYPFFNDMPNWFRPFDTETPQVGDILPKNMNGAKSLLSAICSSRFFCNSDKYSFCFTFQQVPQEQRNMLISQITEGNDNDADTPDTHNEIPKEKEAELIGNQYIQDLYRFFKLSQFRGEFDDPFTQPLNLLQCNPIAFLIDTPQSILRTFNYLIEKEYYDEAYSAGILFEKVCNENECDAAFYQKMGYSLQKQGKYRQATDYYTKADIVKPDTLWTIRHMAQCYRLLGEFNSSLHYYETAEELAPENISLLMQTGECLMSLRRYDEALARFFKVEYLKPQSVRAKRAIAWCSFITGKDDQARKYFDTLMNNGKAGSNDYINAGHVEWINNNRERALELYMQAKKASNDADSVPEQILADREILEKRGADVQELILLRDLLV